MSPAPWTGNKNVIVTLHQIDNGGCVIGDASQTTIKVFAETAFCPLPETRDFTVPVGVTVSLDFPVCASDAPGCDISKLNLPRGLSFVNNLDDPDNPRVSIVGIPTATTSKPLESTLYLTSMGYLIDYDEPHSITFTISVVNTSERLARTKAFSASLAPSTGSDIGAFDGLFFMTHNDDSTMSITVTTRDNIAPATAISGWRHGHCHVHLREGAGIRWNPPSRHAHARAIQRAVQCRPARIRRHRRPHGRMAHL